MFWEMRAAPVRDLVEVKIAVAQSGGGYSSVGQLMMCPDEWQDFASRLGLQQDDNGVWRSR
jgi:hypothetical protein